MALSAYTRLRMGWGAFDFETDSEAPAYDETNTQDATAAGTAVLRRMVIRWDRGLSGDDLIQTSMLLAKVDGTNQVVSFDGADYGAAEAAFDAFWATIKANCSPLYKLDGYRWYREGPGADPPESVVRVTPRVVAGTASGDPLPGQVRTVLSLRTAFRKRWGRMYLPCVTETYSDGSGRLSAAVVDSQASAAHTLAGALSTASIAWMVYSPSVERAYAVERVWIDNSHDVIRSGKLLPTYHRAFPV